MKPHQTNSNRLGALTAPATFAILLGALVLPARADQDWDGDDPIGNFGNNNNWYGNSQPGWSSTGNLTFHYNNGGATSIYDDYGIWVNTMNMYYASTYPRSMTFSGAGNGLYIHCRLENDSSYNQTITIPLDMLGDQDVNNVQINPVNANLTLNGDLDNDNTKDLNVYGNNGKMLTLNTAWPKNNYGVKLLIQQNSIVNITAAQNYTGETDINAGEFWLSSGGSLATSTIYVGNGGATSTTAKIWLHDGGLSLSKPITVNNGNSNTRTVGGLNTSGTVTYNGAVTLNGPVNLEANQSGGTVQFATISAGGAQTATATGPGTVVLGGTSDNANLGVAVSSGTVQLNKSVAGGVHAVGTGLTINSGGTAQLGSSSAGDEIYDSTFVTVNSGGTFDLNGQTETINVLSLAGTGVSGSSLTNSSSVASTLTLNSASTLTADTTVGCVGNITIAGSGAISISGNHTMTKVGAGTLTLSSGGSVDNTGLGLTVNAGTVILNKTGTTGTGTGKIHAAGTVTVNNGGTVQLGGSGGYEIYDGLNTTIASGGVLDMNGQNQTFVAGVLNISGTGISSGGALINSSSSASTLTGAMTLGASSSVSNGSGGLTITGVISDGSSGYSLTKIGTGTLTLQGANTFSGGLTVNGGTVSFASDGTSGGQQLGAYPGSLSAANMTLNGGGLLDTTTATISSKRGITLGSSGGTLDASSGQTLTVSGIVAGTGALTKGANSGTVSLNGVNSYSGNTTISGGTLAIGSAGQLNSGSYSGNITDNGILNYNSSASQTLSGIISGTGSLFQNGSGTLTLSGANSSANNGFSGGVNFNTGRINFNNNNAAGTGTITVGSGATDFSSTVNGIVLPNSISLSSGANPLYYATSGNSIDQTGVISGLGGLTRSDTGAGTVQLSGANTFSGGLTITSRGINFNNPQAAGTGNLTIGDPSAAPANTIQLNAATSLTGANAMTNAVAWNQDFTLLAVNNLEFSGPVTVSSGARTVTVNNGKILTLSGQVSGGAGGITIAGLGTVRLGSTTANANNTYTGQTTVTGTLQLNNATAGYNAIGGDLTINGGSVSYNSAIDNQIPDTANITNNSGTLTFGARSETFNRLVNNGGTNTVSSGTVTMLNNSFLTNGYMQVSSSGEFDFSNNVTMVNATLDLTAGGSTASRYRFLGGDGTGIIVPANATTKSVITNSGGSSGARFAVGPASGSYTYTTVFNIANVAGVDPELEIDAIMSSGSGYTGGINKTGAGRVLLTAADTFSGPITISAGTISLGASGSLNNVSTMNIAAGAIYDVSAVTPGYTISGTLAMSINKTGLALTQGQVVLGTKNLTYGGTLTVTASGDTLAAGDGFILFTNTGTKSGWFSSVTVPALASGISWDTNKLATNGVLDIYNFSTTALSLTTPTNTAATISSNKLANHVSSARLTAAYPATGWKAAVTTAPSSGSTAVVNGDGSLTYTPGATANSAGSDSFTVTFQDGHGWQTMAVSVTVGNGTGQSPNVVYGPITTNGNFVVRFAGLPGTTYTVEKTASLNSPISWTRLGNYTAPTDNSAGFGIGVFQVSDPVGSGGGYYRTVYPSY